MPVQRVDGGGEWVRGTIQFVSGVPEEQVESGFDGIDLLSHGCVVLIRAARDLQADELVSLIG